MSNKIQDVMVPIQLDSGKTLWQKVGVMFPNEDSSKRHSMTISLTALPIGHQGPLRLFVYPQKQSIKQNSQPAYDPPPLTDDDVPF